MKLAVLGTDPDILRLMSAARDAQHEIVWLGDIRPDDAAHVTELIGQQPDRVSEWELLLGRGVVDAVLVGAGTAASNIRAERIKRLAAEGTTQLIVHPAFASVLPYYEIDMVRRESNGVVQHYNPVVGHPTMWEVAAWLRDGHPALGPIHQLACERYVTNATRANVLVHFARDAELLAALAGDIRRVAAIGPADHNASFASLQIQIQADSNATLHWTIGYAAVKGLGLELTLRAEKGVATIRISGDEGESPTWQLETIQGGTRVDEPLESFEPAEEAIARLAHVVAQSQINPRSGASTWESATRAMEVVDAAELSLQKGRTMEVYQQQLTERLAFRGTMAAIGCGLLLLAFLAIVAVAILGGAEGIVRQRLAPAWPLILLGLLAFFLLLQAVPFLARKSHPRDSSD